MRDKPELKDKHLIFMVTHWVRPAVILSVNNLLEIIKSRPDLFLVIIDSNSQEGIKDYLRTVHQERVIIEYNDNNIGKARGINEFIAGNLDETMLPETICSIDPDIIFDLNSFSYLLEAVQNIPKIGMLGMRYANNGFNPERNLWLPPKKLKGRNNIIYEVVSPLFANVAGPIFALNGGLLKDPLKYKMYPIKFKTPYGPDDAALHDFLKWRGYKNGYLNGTEAKHLKCHNQYAEEIRNFKD